MSKKPTPPPPEGKFVVERHGMIHGMSAIISIYAGDWDLVTRTRKKLKPLKPETLQLYRLVPVDGKGNPIDETT